MVSSITLWVRKIRFKPGKWKKGKQKLHLVQLIVVLRCTSHHCFTTSFNNSRLRYCAGLNPAYGLTEVYDGENLRQWSRIEIKLTPSVDEYNSWSSSTLPSPSPYSRNFKINIGQIFFHLFSKQFPTQQQLQTQPNVVTVVKNVSFKREIIWLQLEKYDWHTTLKLKFSIKDFFGKCDRSCSLQRTWSYFLKKSLMKNFKNVWGGEKCSFFRKFGVLCFLETPLLRFTLLSYYRRNIVLSIPELLVTFIFSYLFTCSRCILI